MCEREERERDGTQGLTLFIMPPETGLPDLANENIGPPPIKFDF